MLIINIVNCKYKKSKKTFLYTLFIYKKSSIAKDLAIFENLNVKQISFDKTDNF